MRNWVMAICVLRCHGLSAQTQVKGLMYVNVSGNIAPMALLSRKKAAPWGCLLDMEARAGVEPTYTDLQSGA